MRQRDSAALLCPALDVVHLPNILSSVILVDHGGHEGLLVVGSGSTSSVYSQTRGQNQLSLVVHDSVNVDDDALVGSGLDSFYKFFLGSPVCPDRTFLVKLSQVPDVVASRGFSWQLKV